MKTEQQKPLYTSSRESLISYGTIQSLLKLDRRDRLTDIRLLNDSIQDMSAYLEIDIENAWSEDNIPEQLKEALLSIFIKKHSMYKRAADYAHGYDIDDVIEQKFDDGRLDPDEFFAEFSVLPVDAEIILDRYRKEHLTRYTAVRQTA